MHMSIVQKPRRPSSIRSFRTSSLGTRGERSGCDRGYPSTRESLLTIGLMVALNRGEELRLHLRAAANNGATAEEIREVLLHCAIYCGVPAANAAFHAAKEIL